MSHIYMIKGRNKQFALLDKVLALRRQYSHVPIALIGVGLFEMSWNVIVKRLSVLSYDTVKDSTQNPPDPKRLLCQLRQSDGLGLLNAQ